MKGRKPQPLALKLVNGTPEAQINRNEPPLPPGSAEAPACLEGHARELWDELAPMLVKASVITAGDHSALLTLCLAYAAMRQRPDARNIDCYRRMLSEFGLTPFSRNRIHVPTELMHDDLADFLDKPKKIKA